MNTYSDNLKIRMKHRKSTLKLYHVSEPNSRVHRPHDRGFPGVPADLQQLRDPPQDHGPLVPGEAVLPMVHQAQTPATERRK